MDSAFSYAVYRLVPRVERGERINVGVVVFCRPLQYLEARTALDESRAACLWPDLDAETVRSHLAAIERIARGEDGAGPIAALDTTARFHWLVAPSSTIRRAIGSVRRGCRLVRCSIAVARAFHPAQSLVLTPCVRAWRARRSLSS